VRGYNVSLQNLLLQKGICNVEFNLTIFIN
jgi:hypothetical protein